MNRIAIVADLAGFAGTAIVLLAFGWHSTRKLAAAHYHALNLVGAALLIVSLSVHRNGPALMLEVAWAAIALIGLVGARRVA